MRTLIEKLATSRVFLDPTIVVDEFAELSNIEAEKNDPNNRYVSEAFVQESVKNWTDPVFVIPAELRATAVGAFRKRQKFLGMCNRAGVRIIAGTDGPGIGRLMPGFGLHRELELLVESGLSPFEALRAATLTAAEAMGKENQLGSIQSGKLADMVVVDADPLQRIENLRKIQLVIQGGKTYAPESILEALRARSAEQR
jgi:hypothetical protein